MSPKNNAVTKPSVIRISIGRPGLAQMLSSIVPELISFSSLLTVLSLPSSFDQTISFLLEPFSMLSSVVSKGYTCHFSFSFWIETL